MSLTEPIPFAAAVLARSARRTTQGRRSTADGCAQAWILAVHASERAVAAQARRELAATCRSTRDLTATRLAYSLLFDGFDAYPDALGQAQYDLAMMLSDAWQRGDGPTADEALLHFNCAAVAYTRIHDEAGLATVETDRALVEFATGATDAAVTSLESARLRWRDLQDVPRLAETLLTLGDCLDAADQPEAAIRRYREAEVYFCEIGDGTSANAAAVRAELVARRAEDPGTIVDLRDLR